MTGSDVTRAAIRFVTLWGCATALQACAGKGPQSGGDPCCAATGQVELPATFSFADAETTYYAQAIHLPEIEASPGTGSGESACPEISEPGGEITFSAEPDPASDKSLLVVDGNIGTYTVTIKDDFAGKPLHIRILDGEGKTLVMVALARPAAEGTADDPIPVSPMVVASSELVDNESTLESIVACRLTEDEFEDLALLADVKAAISTELLGNLGDWDSSFVEELKTLIRDTYLDGIQGISGAPAGPNAEEQRQKFAALREAAEEEVDRARNEADPFDDAAQRRAEFARYAWMARNAESSGIDFGGNRRFHEHLQAFAQRFQLRFDSDDPNPATPRELAQYRTSQMLRFENAFARIEHAVTCWQTTNEFPDDGQSPCGDSVGPTMDACGDASIRNSLEGLRTAIVNSAGSAVVMEWYRAANDIYSNFAFQASLDPSLVYDVGGFAETQSEQVQQEFNSNESFWSHGEIRRRLYEGSIEIPGTWEQTYIYAQDIMNPEGLTETQLNLFVDLMFYLNVNSVPEKVTVAAAVP